jgi:hypothetical protein
MKSKQRKITESELAKNNREQIVISRSTYYQCPINQRKNNVWKNKEFQLAKKAFKKNSAQKPLNV